MAPNTATAPSRPTLRPRCSTMIESHSPHTPRNSALATIPTSALRMFQIVNPAPSPAITVKGNAHSAPKYASTGSPSTLPIASSAVVRLVVRWKSHVLRSRSPDTDCAHITSDQKLTSPAGRPNIHCAMASQVWCGVSRCTRSAYSTHFPPKVCAFCCAFARMACFSLQQPSPISAHKRNTTSATVMARAGRNSDRRCRTNSGFRQNLSTLHYLVSRKFHVQVFHSLLNFGERFHADARRHQFRQQHGRVVVRPRELKGRRPRANLQVGDVTVSRELGFQRGLRVAQPVHAEIARQVLGRRDFFDPPAAHHAALFHYADRGAESLELGKNVRRDQDSGALVAQRAQQVAQLEPGLGIESRRRF